MKWEGSRGDGVAGEGDVIGRGGIENWGGDRNSVDAKCYVFLINILEKAVFLPLQKTQWLSDGLIYQQKKKKIFETTWRLVKIFIQLRTTDQPFFSSLFPTTIETDCWQSELA